MLRADLHVHTRFSPDSNLSPEAIVGRCQEVGVNCLAITDHGTLEGAWRVREIAPFPVIVGEEIYTEEGEIMGFFLTSPIPHGLKAKVAALRVKEQGGIVGLPHPFDRLFGTGERLALSLLPYLQVVEVYNARSFLPGNSAIAFAHRHHLLPTAGSDAHTLGEIGNAVVEMPEFTNPEEFLNSLAHGVVRGRRSPFWVHFPSAWLRLTRRRVV